MPMMISGLVAEDVEKGNSGLDKTPRETFKHLFNIFNARLQLPHPVLHILNVDGVIGFDSLVTNERLHKPI